MNHRTPPKIAPDWCKVWKAQGVLSTSAAQREAVFERDRGKCSKCGKITNDWQADHVYPLHNIPPSKLEKWPDCLWFWTLENLATVCKICHNLKSSKERTANAKVRRIIKKSQKIKKVLTKKELEIQEKRREYARNQRKKAREWVRKRKIQT